MQQAWFDGWETGFSVLHELCWRNERARQIRAQIGVQVINLSYGHEEGLLRSLFSFLFPLAILLVGNSPR